MSCLRPFDVWILAGAGAMIAYASMTEEYWMIPIFLLVIHQVVKIVNARHAKAA